MAHVVFPCAAEPYLPHAAPMALLDEILACEGDALHGRVHIGPQTLFNGPRGVPSWVGVEYMAQAIAAWGGVRAQRRDEAVKIGFLVSTRKMSCAVDFFPPDSALEIYARKVTMADNGLATFDCRIEQAAEELVSARINVFQPADPQAFLAEAAA